MLDIVEHGGRAEGSSAQVAQRVVQRTRLDPPPLAGARELHVSERTCDPGEAEPEARAAKCTDTSPSLPSDPHALKAGSGTAAHNHQANVGGCFAAISIRLNPEPAAKERTSCLLGPFSEPVHEGIWITCLMR